MADPFLSEIKIFSFSFPPKGWAFCNGQLLAIAQNQALFSLLGTTYGGNGITTFALPNIQGRVPIHPGNTISLGQVGGEAAHTLIVTELPAHGHGAIATSNVADQSDPTGNTWAGGLSFASYHNQANTAMAPAAIASAGGNQPHNNMSPYLVLSYCIALVGIFPSRN